MKARERDVREECDGCGYGPVECTHAKAPHGTPEAYRDLRENGLWLCDFCDATICGNMALYPTNRYEGRETARIICAGMNILYEKLRRSRPRGER